MVKVNDLTWLSTISSARISFMVHPPPMRNEIFLQTIRKQGEMRVPWGGSALSWYSRPAGSFSLGRFSAPPIHQSPCCWALSLLRAAGLSPNVGWWMKAVPVISHHRFHLQSQDCKLVRKKEEEMFIPLNALWLSFDIINSTSQLCAYLYCSMRQWTLKDICNEILYLCIQLDKCHCCNGDCYRRDSVKDNRECVLKIVLSSSHIRLLLYLKATIKVYYI